jgi:hypothetical protein
MAVDKTTSRSKRGVENSNNWLNYRVTRNDKLRSFYAIFYGIDLEGKQMLNILITTLGVILFVMNIVIVGLMIKQTLDFQSMLSKISMTVLIIVWLLMTNYIIFMPLWL